MLRYLMIGLVIGVVAVSLPVAGIRAAVANSDHLHDEPSEFREMAVSKAMTYGLIEGALLGAILGGLGGIVIWELVVYRNIFKKLTKR